jgi:hypothetical protein
MSERQDRIGPDDADIVVFNKGGRDLRYEGLHAGEEVPREFFYGFLDLQQAGYRAAMQSTSGAAAGAIGILADRTERAFASLTGVGVRPLSLATQKAWFRGASVAISYTDGFSLTLGLAGRHATGGAALIGGFHGLSDIEFRAPAYGRALAHATIRRALAGLDHAFFFGLADREFAIEHYALARARTSVIPFGIDTDFWRPLDDAPEEDMVVAVGQDRNRDYDLLVRAPGRHPTRIITRQKLEIPADATHVSTASGDYFTADSMTDADLRRLYNRARAVIVPLKDVRQPSGYSVTLQAMSCGRPVVLSNIKGLWTKTLLRDGVNCLLVPPNDAQALGDAIGRLRADPQLAERLGRVARETVRQHFGLATMGQHAVALARLGLELRARRAARLAIPANEAAQ